MKRILIPLVVALLASGTVSASEKGDVMATVHKWIDSFNTGDAKTTAAMCADDAIVLDDFSPHLWQGAGACAAWGKAYTVFTQKSAITEPKVTIGKPKHLDVDAEYAYLVAPATYTYNKDGKPTQDAATVTMTLHKSAAGWRIAGWAWADQ